LDEVIAAVEIVPIAIGESDGALVLWEPRPDIGIALPRAAQVIGEAHWGAGEHGDEPCLILYAFFGEQALELVLPQQLPTTPERQVDAWGCVLRRDPELIKIRYGEHPGDREKECVLLFPAQAEQRLATTLRGFAHRLAEAGAAGASDGASASGSTAALSELYSRVSDCIAEYGTDETGDGDA
jgi:hypothetical protein